VIAADVIDAPSAFTLAVLFAGVALGLHAAAVWQRSIRCVRVGASHSTTAVLAAIRFVTGVHAGAGIKRSAAHCIAGRSAARCSIGRRAAVRTHIRGAVIVFAAQPFERGERARTHEEKNRRQRCGSASQAHEHWY
jgi:hypothetical protein